MAVQYPGDHLRTDAMPFGGGVQIQQRQFGEQTCEQIKQDSEIDRERRRLAMAVEALLGAHQELWKRLNTVIRPPPPCDPKDGAIEGCGSSLGNFLQTEATRVSGAVEDMRYLLQSLAL